MQAIEMQTTLGHDIDKDAVARAYDRWAPVYDLVFGPVFERGREAAIAAAERVGGRILEVGVGTGISLPDYSNKNRITGVDISPTMLRKAQDRVRELGLKHVEGLAVMDAADLKFEDNSFDVVVAQYVVTTVPDPEGTLDEFARVLKPGCEIILVSRVGAEAGLRKSLERWFQPAARNNAASRPLPPPKSRCPMGTPAASMVSTKSSTLSSASRYGPSLVICEPMWQSMPTTFKPFKDAACK